MNNRVNIKFVVLLGTVFVLMALGVGYIAYTRLTTSGEEYAQRGERAAEAGDFRTASELYARAVGHDRTRKEWLERWMYMLEHYVPDVDVDFDKNFGFYTSILDRLAVLEITNPEAQRRNLDQRYQRLVWQSASPEAWQQLADATTTAIQQLDMSLPESKSLLRYRGIAVVRQMEQFEPSETVRDQAEEDLRTALAGNPGDVDAAFSLGRWYIMEWRRARRERIPDLIDQRLEELDGVVSMLRTSFDNHPRALLSALELEINKALTGAGTLRQRQVAVASLAGSDGPVLEAFQSAPVEQISSFALDRLVTVMGLMRLEEGFRVSVPIIERVVEERPADIQTLVVLGRALTLLNEPTDAIEVYQRILDIPDLPVSLDGLLQRGFRIVARRSQAENSLRLAELSEDEEIDTALEQFEQHRDSLATQLAGGENSPEILLLDARHAIFTREFEKGLTKLTAYKRETSANANEILRLESRCFLELNQLGAARSTIEELLLREPDNTQAILLAVEIDRRLGNWRRAISLLEDYLLTDPDNDLLQDKLNELLVLHEIAPSDDPVLTSIHEIRGRLRSNPQDTEPIDAMYSVLLRDHADDERAITSYIDYLAATNRTSEALAYALEKQPSLPESREIARRVSIFQAESPLEYQIDLVDLQDMPEVERHMRKGALYRANGKFEEAERHVAAAGEIDPNYPLFVEYRFAEAVDNGNSEAIETFLARAVETNADNANGDIFLALKLQTEKKHAEAIDVLEGVLERMPFSVRTQQMLGHSYLALGRTNDAVEALRASYDARPNNYTAARALIDALRQIQRYSEALEIARDAARLNPRNAEIRQIQLDLEGLAGDRQYAITQHRDILQQLPNNRESRFALINLLISTGQWREARQELDRAARIFGEDDTSYLLQQARWYALHNDRSLGYTPDPMAGLRFLRENYTPSSDQQDTLFLVANFAAEFNLEDEVISALREAAEAAPDEARRRMADYLFSRKRYEQAAQTYGELWSESPEQVIGLRLAETHIRLGQWDDASRVIGELDEDTRDTVEVLLLRAEIHSGNQQLREAFELLNQAVAMAPANPLPYLQRAQFNRQDPNLYADVLADLDQVLRLTPTSIVARQMRASLLIQRGRISEALSELRQAVASDPDNVELHRLYILQLAETGNWTDAMASVDTAAERFRTNDPSWLSLGGQIHLQAAISPSNTRNRDDLMNQALVYFREFHDEAQNAESGVRLAMTALDVRPPAAQEALDALNELPNEMLRTNTRLMLLYGRALFALGNRGESIAALTTALDVATTSDEIKLWFAEIPIVFETQADLLRFLETLTPPSPLALHFDVQTSRLRAIDVASRSELIENLNVSESRAGDDNELLIDIYRLRGALEYQSGDFDAAVETMRKGVALSPNDLEFNNNLAYLLVKEFDDFEGALAPAQRASQIASNNPVILDTLGWVQFRNNMVAQAESTLQRALDLASTPQQELPINIHLGQVKLTQDELRTSRRFADRAADLLRRSPELADTYQADLDDLIRSLDRAEETSGIQR
ncbi:MAG: tetratricopeptide repeat protein [Phycisphaerales bacterium JB043]